MPLLYASPAPHVFINIPCEPCPANSSAVKKSSIFSRLVSLYDVRGAELMNTPLVVFGLTSATKRGAVAEGIRSASRVLTISFGSDEVVCSLDWVPEFPSDDNTLLILPSIFD